MSDVRWMPKLPSLIVGVLALIASVIVWGFGKSRIATVSALILAIIGAGFLWYSYSIKECCVPKVGAFGSAFVHVSFNGCLRQKGWLEF